MLNSFDNAVRHHESRFSTPSREPIIEWTEDLEPNWNAVKSSFLAAVSSTQRARVASLLGESDVRGRGLRSWLRHMAVQGQLFDRSLPAELVEVYLSDDEAMPLHDCSGCGMAIPVRPDWRSCEAAPEQIYFSTCPCCGHRTGLYARWSQSKGHEEWDLHAAVV